MQALSSARVGFVPEGDLDTECSGGEVLSSLDTVSALSGQST